VPDLPDVIHGPRLDLVLVSVEQVLSRAEGATPIPLPFVDPYDVLHPAHSPVRYRITQLRSDPTVNPWLIRVAVERSTNVIVGLANFHDAPDERGMVEIGYRVNPDERGHRYATEMAHLMWDVAAAHPSVVTLRATVAPDNVASLKIIEGAGLVHIGEQDDPEDGLELIYEIGADEYRARNSRVWQPKDL
jgi:[ribosomal protein S5]-alanine N-acetyltransferase